MEIELAVEMEPAVGSILFHVRGNASFPGLNFHSTDVESEPAVLKKIPHPLDMAKKITKKIIGQQKRRFCSNYFGKLLSLSSMDNLH